MYIFFFQAEDGIRDIGVTGVQTCALPISSLDQLRLELVQSLVAPPAVGVYDGFLDTIQGMLPELGNKWVLITRGNDLLLLLTVLSGPALNGFGLVPDEIGRASCRERV